MIGFKRYFLEYALILATMLISLLGFWDIYLGADPGPKPHHHLHLATAFVWMGLLLFQLSLIGKGRYAAHRKVGQIVLLVGPLLVATAAMLSVHSAHDGLVSGEGDFMIVQNVMGTLVLGLLIVLAFVTKRRRALHASFLLSTTIQFMGIALFFALMSFAPPFKIEGPDTAYRFQAAAMTGQAICLFVGLVFFLKDWRNGWPFLLPPLSFPMNEAIRNVLTKYNLIDPLTAWVGSLSKPLTFVGTFALVLLLLAALTRPKVRLRESA